MTNRFFRKTLAAVAFLLMAGVTCLPAQMRLTKKQTEQIKNEIKAFMVSHKGAKFRVYAKLEHPVKDLELERILAEKLFGSGNENVSQALDKYLAQYEKWDRETSFYENSYVSSSDIRLFSKNLDKYNDGDVVFGVFYNGSDKPISKEVDSYVPFLCYKRYVGTNKKFSKVVAQLDEVNTIFTYDTSEKRLLNVTDVFSPEAITRLQINGSPDNTEVIVKPGTDNIIYSVMAQGEKEFRLISMSQNPEIFTERINRLVEEKKKAVEQAEEKRTKQLEAYKNSLAQRDSIAKMNEEREKILAYIQEHKDEEISKEMLEKLEELKKINTGEKPYDIVEVMPRFPGGDGELMDWFRSNMKYPSDAEENGIQGRVIVRFVVETDGSVDNVSIVRSVHPSLDREAFRLVNEMPRWMPGVQAGVVVPVWFTFPITFTLQ